MHLLALGVTTVDLTDADVALLRRLREGDQSVSSLASGVEADAATIEERLVDLTDNALVREHGDGYELTGSGRRVLESPGDGRADERVDTPPAVDHQITSLDLAPDAEEAVRNAFTDLRNYGRLSRDELQERVFSENPAGYDDPDQWWSDLVRDQLLTISGVDAPDEGATLQYVRNEE